MDQKKLNLKKYNEKVNNYEIMNDLCFAFYSYKKSLRNKDPNIKFRCYIIKKEIMEKFKININYDEFEKNYNNGKINNKLKNKSSNICNPKEIKNSINQEYFNNSEDLIKELKNKKEFYIINSNLWDKIGKKNDKDFLVYFKFINDEGDKIVLIMNEKEELLFNNNNECIIIGESNLIKNNYINIKNIKDEKRNQILKNDENETQISEEIKGNLKIIIRLFYYYKELKEKENDSFQELTDEKKETVYLINKSWIEKLQNFFEYKELEEYLIDDDNNKNSPELIDQNNIFISDVSINKIINKLPNKYLNKIKNKNLKDFNKKIDKFNYEKKKLITKKEKRFLNNIQIINNKIYTQLNDLKYELEDSIIECHLYFIGNKKLLLLFKSQIGSEIFDEIGFINKENKFIPEYLFDYEEKNISLEILNDFFSKKFVSFCLDSQKVNEELIYKNNLTFGFCYKINIPKLNDDSKNNFVNQLLNDSSKAEQKKDEKTKKKSEYKDKLDKLKKDPLKKKEKEENFIEYNKKGIEIVLLLYKFYIEIRNYLNQSLNDNNDNEAHNINKCYLIRKEWLDKFKNHFYFDKISEILRNKDILEIEKDKKKMDNLIKDIINELETEILNNDNHFQKLNDEFFINNYSSNLIKIQDKEEIYYFKECNIINDFIYKKLYEYGFLNCPNESYEIKLNNYFINKGKIILKYNYKLNNDKNKYYSIIIGDQNDKNIFKTETIIFFDKNKSECILEFEKLNKATNIEYNINNPNAIKFENILLFKKFNDQIQENDLKRNKYIELLLNIYIIHLNIKDNLSKNLNLSNIENYYIINKQWITILMEELKYNVFKKYIDIKNEDLNPSIPLSRYKEKNNSFIKNSRIDDESLKEIISLFPKDYLDLINNKIKEEPFLQQTNNIDLLSLKLESNEIESNKYNFINYFNNLSIINTNIKEIISELFNYKIEQKNQFLLGDRKIIMSSNKKGQNSILIGSLDNNYNFNAEILLDFNDENYINLFFEKFKKHGYLNVMNDFNFNNKNKVEIKGKNGNNKGYAYKIKLLGNSNDNQTINNFNQFSSTLNQNFQNVNNINESTQYIESKQSGKNIKDNGIKRNGTDIKDKPNIFDINMIIKEQNEYKSIEEEKVKIQNNNLNKIDKNINIQLNKYTIMDIKALITYYLFFENIKQKLKKKEYDNINCYLINYNWMNNFKEFYLYNELIEEIKKNLSLCNEDINKIELLYNKLDKEYLQKIKINENQYQDNNFNADRSGEVPFTKFPISNNIKYPHNFDIINEDIYDKINERYSSALKTINKKEILIKDGKIFIKCEYNQRFEIIVGKIDFTNNKFISKLLFNYNSKQNIEKNFDVLGKTNYSIFKRLYIKENILINLNLKLNINQKIGEIFDLSSNNVKETKKDIENKKKSIKLDERQKLYIDVLLEIFFYEEILKNLINQSSNIILNIDNAFIVNKELIDICKNSNYNSLKKILYDEQNRSLINKMNDLNRIKTKRIEIKDEIIEILSKQYINFIQELDDGQILNQLNTNSYSFSTKLKINKYKDKEFIYFDNCKIIGENLQNFLFNNNDINENQLNYISISYLAGKKNIFIFFNNIINIGFINDSNVFIPKMVFLCDRIESLNSIKNQIHSNLFENIKKNIKKIDNNIFQYSNTKNFYSY